MTVKRNFLITLLAMALTCCSLSSMAAPKKRTIKSAQNEQSATKKRINETTRRLNDNQKQTERTMSQLNLIRGEITQKENQILHTRNQVDSIERVIRNTEDSLARLDTRLEALKDTYVKALRQMQGRRSFSDGLAYIFSSKTFSEAYARMRYVKEFSKWRKRKAQEIRKTRENIKIEKQRLTSLHSQRTSSLNLLSNDQAMLKAKQDETDRLVAKLQSDGKSLQKALDKEKKRLKTIDNEITRMIEAERIERQRREAERKKKEREAERKKKDSKKSAPKGSKKAPTQPAAPKNDDKPTPKATKPKSSIDNSDPDAAMTRRFEAAKGSMTFPVASPYRIVGKYGSVAGQPFNTGIEIVLDGSSTARAVFDGTVSRIFQNHDGNYSVMVRHGAYITVYYNIKSLSVKANTTIKAGQTIGQVGVDSRYGKPMLHFEVRKGSQTQNPMQWVR